MCVIFRLRVGVADEENVFRVCVLHGEHARRFVQICLGVLFPEGGNACERGEFIFRAVFVAMLLPSGIVVVAIAWLVAFVLFGVVLLPATIMKVVLLAAAAVVVLLVAGVDVVVMMPLAAVVVVVVMLAASVDAGAFVQTARTNLTGQHHRQFLEFVSRSQRTVAVSDVSVSWERCHYCELSDFALRFVSFCPVIWPVICVLSALLRRGSDNIPCEHVRFIVPLDLFHGCATVESICDLWCHDLMGEKWTALIRRTEFHPQLVEFVSPGPAGRRHELRGLAIFTVSTSLLQEPPTIGELDSPVLEVAPSPTYLVDFPSMFGADVMGVLDRLQRSAGFIAAQAILARPPGAASRSVSPIPTRASTRSS